MDGEMEVVYFILCIMVVALVDHLYRHFKPKRFFLIEQYVFPEGISARLAEKYPHLSPQQIDEILAGLRQYFQLCLLNKRQQLSMPSEAVDQAWHEFILSTRAYQHFCNHCFGYFLHHTPAEAMVSKEEGTEGLARVWKAACKLENIDPIWPQRLPHLFEIDAKFKIENGFYYSKNCQSRRKGESEFYCASAMGGGGDSGWGVDGDAGGGCSGGGGD